MIACAMRHDRKVVNVRHLVSHRGTVAAALVLTSVCAGSCGVTTTGFRNAVGLSREVSGTAEIASKTAAAGGDAASAPPTERAETGPLSITVENAILLALERNRGLSVQRLAPARRATAEARAAAAFDPRLAASASASHVADFQGSGSPYDGQSSSIGVSALLPTGTQVGVSLASRQTDPRFGGDEDSVTAEISITQPLMRGAGRAANLAAVRQAALDTRASEYELRGYTEALVARVESAYWNSVLAEGRIAVFEQSLALAEEELRNTRERVSVGVLAEIELDAAGAEVASRDEALVNARAARSTSRIELLRLLSPRTGGERGEGQDFWDREIVLLDSDSPALARGEIDEVTVHVAAALRQRPDIRQAKLATRRGDLEVARTRNGLLPKLDLFVNVGTTGYSDSFRGAFDNLDTGGTDFSGGVSFEWALGNRWPHAEHRRAVVTREEAELAVKNLEELVQVDVRTAYIEVTRTRKQMEATAKTRAFREKVWIAEKEKSRVGKSTPFLVALAHRDLVASRVAEIEAKVGHRKALVELYRADGSLLSRRGVVAPGWKGDEEP